MNNRLVELFPHEWDGLLEALLRDLRIELAKCKNDSNRANLHRHNVKRNIQILDALNPKRQSLHKNRFVTSTEAAAENGVSIRKNSAV
jgi:hypothetical protein